MEYMSILSHFSTPLSRLQRIYRDALKELSAKAPAFADDF